MKRSFAVLALLLVVSMALSQTTSISTTYYRVDTYLANAKHYANSAGDSLATFSLPYGGTNTMLLWPGQLPDSVRVVAYASSDTLAADWHVKLKPASGAWKWVLVDSLKSGTMVARGLSKATWWGHDVLGIAFLQRAAGASALATTCYTTVKLERYFAIPPK